MKDRMTQYPHSLKLKCEAMVENKDFYPVASRATGFKNPGAHWPTAISSGPLMAKFTLAAFLKVGSADRLPGVRDRTTVKGGPRSFQAKNQTKQQTRIILFGSLWIKIVFSSLFSMFIFHSGMYFVTSEIKTPHQPTPRVLYFEDTPAVIGAGTPAVV